MFAIYSRVVSYDIDIRYSIVFRYFNEMTAVTTVVIHNRSASIQSNK